MTTLCPGILLIEDDEDDARLIRVRLQRAGHTGELDHRRSAEEGLRALAASEDRDRIVLTDLSLPRKDGFAVLAAVADHHRVFVVTSSRSDEDRERALAAGALAVFRKPLSREDVARILGAAS